MKCGTKMLRAAYCRCCCRNQGLAPIQLAYQGEVLTNFTVPRLDFGSVMQLDAMVSLMRKLAQLPAFQFVLRWKRTWPDFHRTEVSAKAGKPIRIRRVARHVPVVVRLAIVPPNRASFSEGPLCRIDSRTRPAFRASVLRALCSRDSAAGIHQLFDESFASIRIEPWIAHPPETAADDEIPPVWSHRMLCPELGLGVLRRLSSRHTTSNRSSRSEPSYD